MSDSSEVRVWDPFVRVFHWLLLAAFAAAYISGGEPLWLHSRAGYLVAALVVLRVIWGVAGSKHARFSDFVYPAGTVLSYGRDLLRRKSRRYIGHSPAGGAMVLLLLLSLAGTAVSGMALLAEEKNAGPLAPLFGGVAVLSVPADVALIAPARADEDGDGYEHREANGHEGHERGEGVFEEVHEFFGNLTLILAGFHLAGVLFASFAHRENLVRSMITGRKRPEPETD